MNPEIQGIISIVSDTWDFWQVMTDFLPRLKEEILARNGRVVIRPDSGDPVDIVCGLNGIRGTWSGEGDGKYYFSRESGMDLKEVSEGEFKGAYEILWDIFGGTINDKGYKVLHPSIGLIYGDSITLERQKTILSRLEAKGFAASNLVLGIGLA